MDLEASKTAATTASSNATSTANSEAKAESAPSGAAVAVSDVRTHTVLIGNRQWLRANQLLPEAEDADIKVEISNASSSPSSR
jgi:hypothetical protein